MRPKIIWATALLLLVAAGIYVLAHQKSGSSPRSGSAPVPADFPIQRVKMHAHATGDHDDDQDHCIQFDDPGKEQPLTAEVETKDALNSNPVMGLYVFYVNPHSGRIKSELLFGICSINGSPGSSKSCQAQFDENHLKLGLREWHLSDGPDGTYSTAVTLASPTDAKLASNAAAAFYSFRNPRDCSTAAR